MPRYEINAFGQKYEADGHLPLKVGDDMGLESIKVDDTGLVESHTIAFSGIIITDYSPEVTAEQFFEEMEKVKAIVRSEREARDARYADVLKRAESAYL